MDAKKLSYIANQEASTSSGSSSPSDGAIDTAVNCPEKIGLSFSACGFLGSYHFGVMACFQKNGKKLLSNVDKCAGASGGSLIAALMVLAPDKLNDGLELLYKLADELYSYRWGALEPGFYLAERLVHIVEPFIPEDISYAQNRLFISEYYRILGKMGERIASTNKIISNFPSREYLIKCLMASCYIPIYSGGVENMSNLYHPPPERYIDGGFSNNLPTFDDVKTITISPFCGNAAISPQDRSIFEWTISIGNQAMKVNLQNMLRGVQSLFPPTNDALKKNCEIGDGMSYLLRNGHLEREAGTEV